MHFCPSKWPRLPIRSKGRLFGSIRAAVGYIRNGDTNAAESYVARNRSLLAEAQRWPVFPIYGLSWQAFVEDGNARVAEARGRFADAETAYHKAFIFYTSALKTVSQWESKPPEGEIERAADWALALEGRVKVKQGRVGEGEADVRRALLSRLAKSGKFHADTAGVLGVLVFVIQEQGRYQEAERLQRQVIEIYQGLGYGVDSGPMVNAQVFLAQILNLERRYDEASKLYDEIDVWTAKWEPSRREAISGGLARVSIMLAQGNYDNALEIAQRTFDRERGRSGDKSFNTAVARGYLAIALARKSKTGEALQAFKESIPVLLTASGGSDDDAGSTAAAREGRVRFVIEGLFARAGAQSGDCPGQCRRRNLRLCGRAARSGGSAGAAGFLGPLGNRQAGTGKAGARVAGRRKADRRSRCHIEQPAGAASGRTRGKSLEGHAGRDRRAAGRASANPEGDRQEISGIRQPRSIRRRRAPPISRSSSPMTRRCSRFISAGSTVSSGCCERTARSSSRGSR